MRQISLLIKPASSLCNMHCTYCFYRDISNKRKQYSMGIMKKKTIDSIIEQTMNLKVSHINFCFQGGEPTLAGLDYFRYFISCVDKQKKDKVISYSIQTNGLNLNDEWYQLFKNHNFLVGISLDGFIENHNSCRRDNYNRKTFQMVMNHIREMELMNIEYNILTVLTHQLAKHPKKLFQFYLENGIKYVQLIPCLPSLENKQFPDSFSLTPKDFSSFYKIFFDEWYEAYQKNKYLSVSLFDQIIPMYIGIPPTLCGMLGKCHLQLVIEGDGNVYPCDFYALDEYCCGNINTSSLSSTITHLNIKNFLRKGPSLSRQCQICRYYNMCYGYCKRVGVCLHDNEYCGYKEFLEYTEIRMTDIARKIGGK